jgi:hypothetical protein
MLGIAFGGHVGGIREKESSADGLSSDMVRGSER